MTGLTAGRRARRGVYHVSRPARQLDTAPHTRPTPSHRTRPAEHTRRCYNAFEKRICKLSPALTHADTRTQPQRTLPTLSSGACVSRRRLAEESTTPDASLHLPLHPTSTSAHCAHGRARVSLRVGSIPHRHSAAPCTLPTSSLSLQHAHAYRAPKLLVLRPMIVIHVEDNLLRCHWHRRRGCRSPRGTRPTP